MKILLLNMPFVSISRPAIGISLLKAVLAREGIEADVAYPNILFAQLAGLDTYAVLDEKVTDSFFAGDWLFAQGLFGDQLDLDTYVATLQHHLSAEEHRCIMEARGVIEPFLDMCMTRFRIADYPVVGFTTTFEQNLASLALAKRIKERHPEKIIVFGGANCEGPMGRQMLQSFQWIDYVCMGEGEIALPDLIRSIDGGNGAVGVNGIAYREDGGRVVANESAELVADMDSLPIPDYQDYSATLAGSGLSKTLNPVLLIETSRGCWWGAKSHCTFCGLNGETMNFRSKSPTRVLEELKQLHERHGLKRFVAVDNIMDMAYFRTVLPMLRDSGLGFSLFYETKSNLKKEQVALLKEAGVTAIQPGIESLSSHVLQLMKKGVSAIQNIQLLKWCKEYGVTVAWNLLHGFPGETRDDYDETLKQMDALFHLQPPHSMGAVRMDRFSPYFSAPESFGLVNVRPFAIYQYIYPLPPEEIENLAYFFEYEYADGQDHDALVEGVERKVSEWRASHGCSLTMSYGIDPDLLIQDTRPNRIHSRIALSGVQSEVYDFCRQKRNVPGILRFLQDRYLLPDGFDDWLVRFLNQMVDWRLMIRDRGQYLSVAIKEAAPIPQSVSGQARAPVS